MFTPVYRSQGARLGISSSSKIPVGPAWYQWECSDISWVGKPSLQKLSWVADIVDICMQPYDMPSDMNFLFQYFNVDYHKEDLLEYKDGPTMQWHTTDCPNQYVLKYFCCCHKDDFCFRLQRVRCSSHFPLLLQLLADCVKSSRLRADYLWHTAQCSSRLHYTTVLY